ncbi:MAG: heparinase II/III family protein [Kiritimatiellae bacterium]|jgi:hypothetical protein|nr:heparinase II/III family protein [Kiritimatiellia bacterium]
MVRLTHHVLSLTACLIFFAAIMPYCQAAALLEDHDFERVSATEPGPWEFRYGHKGGDASNTLPLWLCVPRTDAPPSDQGRYLSVEKKGRCAGTVAIGQRVTLPATLPPIDFGVRYQAFCAGDRRSGIVTLMLFSPKAWDALPAVPEDVKKVLSHGDIYEEVIQPQGDDTLDWTLGRVGSPGFRAALTRNAGKEIVVAVVFTTWHKKTEEWANFDDFWLGDPLPHITANFWPKYIYQGEPLTLTVSAATDGELPLVDLQVRKAGCTNNWISFPMAGDDTGVFRAQVTAELTQTPLEAFAILRNSPACELKTEPITMLLTKRPSHPSLFYNQKELDRMREKISEFPWAKRIFDGTKKRAESWLKKPFEPQVICGWWWHHYNCKECGGRLDMRGPHEHVCRSCGKTWDTEILFHVYWSKVHGNHAKAAHDLALTYQITGEEKYAQRAIEILLWYADHYTDFPQSDKGGKVVSQSLDECCWLLSIMNAADLAYPAMTREQSRHIEQDLIYAGALYTRKYRGGIHNIRCWHNSCWAGAGYFVGDPEMIDFARNHKFGFVAQMEQGVLQDGMWYERSMGYHSYTVSAISYQLKAAMHAGDDLYKLPQVQKLITFPVMIAFPNLMVPSLNDGGFQRSPINPNKLELAAAWYNDPIALSAMRKRYEAGASRSSMEAWQFGEELPEGESYTPPPSVDLSGAGLAVLRAGSGKNAVCAMLEYGEHGGGHGHPDKLQLILYGLAKQLCPDLGTTGYANPLHPNYYKTTPAHNTITINGKNMAAKSGRLLGFEENSAYSAAVAGSDTVYKGYNLIRRILLCDNILVDEFIVQGKSKGTLDWFLRADGQLAVSPDVKPTTENPLSPPYQYLKDLKTVLTTNQWSATWTFKEKAETTPPKRLILTMKAEAGTQVGTCLAPGGAGLAQHWGTLRIRRNTNATRFLTVYQLLNSDTEEKPVSFEAGLVRVGKRIIELPKTPAALPHLR